MLAYCKRGSSFALVKLTAGNPENLCTKKIFDTRKIVGAPNFTGKNYYMKTFFPITKV
jgi:hypothetical protein